MDYTFRYALMIEMRDLFAKNEIIEERGAASSAFQRVLIVSNRNPLIRCEKWTVRPCLLVRFGGSF
jgi:hypothetical protein